jgi:hypothetical protein
VSSSESRSARAIGTIFGGSNWATHMKERLSLKNYGRGSTCKGCSIQKYIATCFCENCGELINFNLQEVFSGEVHCNRDVAPRDPRSNREHALRGFQKTRPW